MIVSGWRFWGQEVENCSSWNKATVVGEMSGTINYVLIFLRIDRRKANRRKLHCLNPAILALWFVWSHISCLAFTAERNCFIFAASLILELLCWNLLLNNWLKFIWKFERYNWLWQDPRSILFLCSQTDMTTLYKRNSEITSTRRILVFSDHGTTIKEEIDI